MIDPHPHQSAANYESGPDRTSGLRKAVAWTIRGAGFLLSVALTSFYLFMAWDSPPDMSHAPLYTVINFYLRGPLLLFCVPMLLAGWIASRIDHRKLTD